MNRIAITAIFLFLIFNLTIAQVGRSYGGPSSDYGYEVEATGDGGFAVVGLTNSYGAGATDYWLVKFDSLGNKVWAHPFGTTSYEQIFSLRLTEDSGYLIAGYSGSPAPNKEGALLYKVNSAGQEVWSKLLFFGNIDHAHSLFENLEGGYYMAGHTESMGNTSGAMWVVKLDSARNIIWDSTYTPLQTSEHVHAATLTPDSGLLILGHSNSTGYESFRLVKIDKNGHEQWSQTYSSGSNGNDTPYELRITRQGNYAMFGYSETAPNTSTFWLKVVDPAGNSVLDKHYGTGRNICWSGRQTADNGFMMIGNKTGGTYGGEDFIVFKTDSAGNLQWTKQFGGPAEDIGYGFTPFHGNDYVLVGSTLSFPKGGGEDMWVILIDSAGNTTDYPRIPVDASVSAVINPVGNFCSANYIPKVVLKNEGTQLLTSCNISFNQNNDSVMVYHWSGSLNTAATDTVFLSLLNAQNGTDTFYAWCSEPDSVADLNPANDSSFSSFSIDTITFSIPFFEGFETDSFPPVEWKLAGSSNMLGKDTAGGFGNSAHSIRARFFNVSSGTGLLISPHIDLMNTVAPVTLSFSIAYPSSGSTSFHYRDTLKISVSEDCGNSWHLIYAKADTQLQSAPVPTGEFMPTANQWKTEKVSLNNYAGEQIQFRFETKSGYGNDLYIDDINIDNSPNGIKNIEGSQIAVYPNPANNEITIISSAKGKIQFMNYLGQLEKQTIVESGQQSIDITGLNSGVHLLELEMPDKTIVKKIMVVR